MSTSDIGQMGRWRQMSINVNQCQEEMVDGESESDVDISHELTFSKNVRFAYLLIFLFI